MTEFASPPVVQILVLAASRREQGLPVGSEDALAALAATWKAPRALAPRLQRLAVAGIGPVGAAPALADLSHELRYALANALRFATLADAPVVGPDHLLLGLLWHPLSASAQDAAAVGLTFDDAYRAVTGFPATPFELRPAEQRTVEWGERVTLPVSELTHVLTRIAAELPDDAPLSFNHDEQVAWFRTARGIDLAHAVEAARLR